MASLTCVSLIFSVLVFPRIVTCNTKAEAECFLFFFFFFSHIYFTILPATKARWNLSSDWALWVWSNFLETVQFDEQNRHLTIFCISSVSKRNFPFRSFFKLVSQFWRKFWEMYFSVLRQYLFQFSQTFTWKLFPRKSRFVKYVFDKCVLGWRWQTACEL